MDTGFGQNLEGFLIKGNLSLSPSELPYLQGDGSIEGAGSLYINYIKEYNSTQGIDIQNVKFINSQIIIPYDVPSSNSTTAALILENGGLSINQTNNSLSITEGGALTIAGGASIAKNLNVGGIINVNNHSIINVPLPLIGTDAVNKDYVDSVANKLSGNFTTGQIIIADSVGDSIRGFDSFTFIDGELLRLDSPFKITNTQPLVNSTTASFIVFGGVSIGDDTIINGTLDLAGNSIINVTEPLEPSDAATKFYVDNKTFGNLLGNLNLHQVVVGSTSSNFLDSYPQFTFNGTNLVLGTAANFVINNTQEPYAFGDTNYSFLTYGGAIINKNLIVGGFLDVNGNNIINVAEPIEPSDAATKFYVDNIKIGGNFTTGQLIIADSNGDAIRGYDNLTWVFNGTTGILNLFPNSQFYIHDTTNSLGLGSGGTFTTLGGASFQKDVYIGGFLDMNGNNIINVAEPIEPSDVATKFYVDNNAKIAGNFTTGQLIIADSNGDAIRGYDNLTWVLDGTRGTLNLLPNSQIIIYDTTNSTGLGTGGTLTTLGGASFQKNVWIGGELDVNLKNIKSVATPIEDFDAVNKAYVDALISSVGQNITGNTFTLNNNVTTPEDIPVFFYPSSTKAFIATVYGKFNNIKCAFFTLYGFKCDSHWKLHTTFIGEPIGVKFYIRWSNGQGIIQYTNSNISGITNIRFKTVSQIDQLSSSLQSNFTLLPNVTDQIIPQLTFSNTQYHAFKLLIHIFSDIDDRCGFYFLSCVRHGNDWVMNFNKLGDARGINFDIVNLGNSVGIKYSNTNSATDYEIRVKNINILTNLTETILYANTLTQTTIENTNLSYPTSDVAFQLTLFVEVPTLNKSALYEINGLVCDNTWKINSRYIGDDTDVNFFINTHDDIGKLEYTNTNTENAIIKFLKSSPTIFEPLAVNKGGTGNDYLLPYAVLRGDGTNPILATEDFIYKDYELILGNQSKILLKNTDTATSITSGGTFTSYGGGSFAKDVHIGGLLDMNLNRIINVDDPIVDYDAVNKLYVDSAISNINLTSTENDWRIEYTWNLENNITQDVPNLYFDGSIKAFITNIYVESSEKCGIYTIYGFYSDSGWKMTNIFTGKPTGISFNIRTEDDIGYIQYTNKNLYGLTSIRYRTITRVYVDVPVQEQLEQRQLNYTLLPSIFSPISIPDLTFNNTTTDGINLITYVSSQLDNKFGIILSHCVKKGNTWFINNRLIGDITGITFSINAGTIQYTNYNTSDDYIVRVRKISTLGGLNEILLNRNTSIPSLINNDLAFPNSDTYFQLSAFVYVPDLNKYALYDLRGVVCNDIWTLNSTYIGDTTGIQFYIDSTPLDAKLYFTNSNSSDAFIKFIKVAPIESLKPLAVNKGGTGTTYLTPNAVLRGNGGNAIIGSSDFIYEDYKLILGEASSIIIKNTTNSTNLTTGTFITFGGLSINKDLLVGGKIIVNNKNITPNDDDIVSEKSFTGENNIVSPTDITGLNFSNSNTKSFTGIICITVTTDTDVFDKLIEIRGLKKSSGWILNTTSSIGDDIGINLTINPTGQLKYTSTNIPNWISTQMKFRALTTTL